MSKSIGEPIRSLQVEPGAILTDPAFRAWDYRLRGLYLSLKLELCAAGGSVTWDPATLARNCRYANGAQFMRDFEKISGHFRLKDGTLRSARVTALLSVARKYRKIKRLA